MKAVRSPSSAAIALSQRRKLSVISTEPLPPRPGLAKIRLNQCVALFLLVEDGDLLLG
jgi:hypothetical protein